MNDRVDSMVQNDLQISERHIRWFVNFLAEPSLKGKELDEICSNLEGKIEVSLGYHKRFDF